MENVRYNLNTRWLFLWKGEAMRESIVLLLVATLMLLAGCGDTGETPESMVLAEHPCDSMDGVITRTGLEVDSQMDGGSLKATAVEPTTFNLYEVPDLEVEDARLIYRAKVRTQDVRGQAYLEMWVEVEGLGQFFSRGLDQVLSGTNEWSTLEIPFFVEQGQTAGLVKLNLVIEGSGTAWIKDIELIQGSL